MTRITRKHLFDLPADTIYLDGNSLGPRCKGSGAVIDRMMRHEWGNDLIRAWNIHGWMDMPQTVGDMIAPLIGAPTGSVIVGDTLSIKVFQAVSAALNLRPSRRVILSDSENFPSDLYVAQGLVSLAGQGYELRTVQPEHLHQSINDDVAAVLLTHVDYRTGAMYDMQAISAKARRHGAVTIWDLAHSTGALDLDIFGSGAEFAVGCTYKYLNGGPGAPAFIYVHPSIADQVQPALVGWMGHAAPFQMSPDYAPAKGAGRLRIGTPPIVQLALLQHALGIWADVDIPALRRHSLELSDRFIDQVARRCPQLKLVTPLPHDKRGSHVSFAFEHGYAAIQALIARGVIGDFREPDLMRFGITPLYIDESDIDAAVIALDAVLHNEEWRNPVFQTRSADT